jgi:hypothetical protein
MTSLTLAILLLLSISAFGFAEAAAAGSNVSQMGQLEDDLQPPTMAKDGGGWSGIKAALDTPFVHAFIAALG